MATVTTRSQSANRLPISAMEKFDPETSNWQAWKQRFDNYVAFLDVSDNKKANALVESLERKEFEALYSVCHPEKISKFNVDQLFWKLDKLYSKQTSKHYERSKFSRLAQQPGESFVDFANQIREKSIQCEFTGTILDEMQLAVFMGGVSKEKTRQFLYAKEPTTLEGALSDSQRYENRQDEREDSVNFIRNNRNGKAVGTEMEMEFGTDVADVTTQKTVGKRK